jgi:predicted transcriptional regulator
MTDPPSQYRSKCRIYADILTAIQESERAKVTYLLHEANLSHERLMSHLAKMVALGLIERHMDGEIAHYTTTQKGKKYLMEFRKVKEFGDAFGVEV